MPIRDFPNKEVESSTSNLIVGSGHLRFIRHRELPCDVQVHSYRRSTSKEKMRIPNKYDNHELNSVTIQEGTNSLLNDHRPIANLVDDQIELIKLCIDKFQPNIVFVLEVPPNVMINHFPINHNNASSLFAELRGQRQAGNLSSRGKRKPWSTPVSHSGTNCASSWSTPVSHSGTNCASSCTTQTGASQCGITRINLIPGRNYERSSSQGCGTSLLSSNGKSPQSIAPHLDESPLKGAS